MRPLDQLFGALPYPYDALLPSALWLSFCAAAMVVVARRLQRLGPPVPARAVRAGLWLAAGDIVLWLLVVAVRARYEGASPLWLAVVEVPLAIGSDAIDALLWNVVGVASAVEPRELFRGYSSWNGSLLVLAASLLNEAACVALTTTCALGSAAALRRAAPWRVSRTPRARTAGTARES